MSFDVWNLNLALDFFHFQMQETPLESINVLESDVEKDCGIFLLKKKLFKKDYPFKVFSMEFTSIIIT